MDAENCLPFELLPDGVKGLWLHHDPDAPEEERWVIERLTYGTYGERSPRTAVAGATPRAAFMAALAMIDAGHWDEDLRLKPCPLDTRIIRSDNVTPRLNWPWRLRRRWDFYRPWWRAPRPTRFPDWDE